VDIDRNVSRRLDRPSASDTSPRRRFRRARRVALAIGFAVLPVTALATVPFASAASASCGYLGLGAGNQITGFSVGCYGGVVQYGVYATNYMNSLSGNNPYGVTLTQGIIAWGGSPCSSRYAAVGVGDGYPNISWSGNRPFFFWAEYIPGVGNTVQPSGYVTLTGQYLANEIEYQGNGNWTATHFYGPDNRWVTLQTITKQGFGACLTGVGAMVFPQGGIPPGPNSFFSPMRSSTYDFTNIYTQDTGWAWHLGAFGNGQWVWPPCYAGSAHPCFNGVFYGSAHWANNLG
jgi:hypothetical protein